MAPASPRRPIAPLGDGFKAFRLGERAGLLPTITRLYPGVSRSESAEHSPLDRAALPPGRDAFASAPVRQRASRVAPEANSAARSGRGEAAQRKSPLSPTSHPAATAALNPAVAADDRLFAPAPAREDRIADVPVLGLDLSSALTGQAFGAGALSPASDLERDGRPSRDLTQRTGALVREAGRTVSRSLRLLRSSLLLMLSHQPAGPHPVVRRSDLGRRPVFFPQADAKNSLGGR